MPQGREPRVSSKLSVWVAGRDLNGNLFKQTAHVIDVSRLGGRLADIRCLKAAGEVIQIKCRGKRAHFRVVWIDRLTGQAGIRCTEPDRYIWGVKLPVFSGQSHECDPDATAAKDASRDGYTQDLSPRERQHPRYACVGGVQVRRKNLTRKSWGRVSTLSAGGCYVDNISPYPQHTRLELLISIYGVDLKSEGVVRYSQPGVGMGVVFSDMGQQDRWQLQQVLAKLSRRLR